MANPSKAKGTKAETDLVKWLRVNGFPKAERLALAGVNDQGDVRGCSGLIFEVKHWATYTDADVTDWMRQTAAEKRNAHASIAVLVIRRTGKGNPADWWAWHATNDWGWQCTWLGELIEELRAKGWGETND